MLKVSLFYSHNFVPINENNLRKSLKDSFAIYSSNEYTKSTLKYVMYFNSQRNAEIILLFFGKLELRDKTF